MAAIFRIYNAIWRALNANIHTFYYAQIYLEHFNTLSEVFKREESYALLVSALGLKETTPLHRCIGTYRLDAAKKH